MKYLHKRLRLIPLLYGVLTCMAVVLLLVVACTENVLVYAARHEREQYAVEDVAFGEAEDDSAPAGVRQTYSWTLPEQVDEGGCLAFYLVHQYAEVCFDRELMYSLMPQPDNRIGRTIGSNWVFVPLYPEDAGKEVRVEITPAYESFRGRMVTFYTGSHLQIYLSQLKKDLPQIVLSILAIAVGFTFAAVSLYNRLKRGSKQGGEMICLGIFSVIIGIWRLSDNRFSPLLFPQNPLLLSYITLITLMLAPVPLLLFIRGCSRGVSHRMLDAVCVASVLSGMAVITFQTVNIMDFRESLPATHAIIVLTVAVVMVNELREWKRGKRSGRSLVMAVGFLMCTLGVLLDLLLYYIRGSSAGVVYTLAAFLAYVILMGIESNRELNYRARIDIHTGLYNKSCCSERIHENETVTEPTAVLMFDLNGLKRVNDTFGHETGDNMIFLFADILRKNLPGQAFVGRYGGDEFIAILQPGDDEAVRRALADVAGAVERYNRGGPQVPISYAAGSAVSKEYPGASVQKLLEAADTAMYGDKRQQYAAGQTGV